MLWVYIWLGVIVLSVIIECVTFDLASVWFIGGGLVALILAAFKIPYVWQIVVFVAVSAVLLATCRRPLLKLLGKNTTKTNADALVGKEYSLLTPISFGVMGSLKVNGVEWSAVSEKDTDEIAAGTVVRVVEIKGNKLIVKEI